MERDSVTISDRAAAHIAGALSCEPPGSMLRVSVSGGGCSGFRYEFSFDRQAADSDLLILHKGAKILIDPSHSLT